MIVWGEILGWAVFQTYGSQEKKAVQNLVRQGLIAFCPFYTKPVLPTAKIKKPREVPLFPCYGFVQLNHQSEWGKPNNTYGVIRLLTNRHRIQPTPLWVPDDYIDSIAGLQTKFTNVLLPINTVVRVRDKDSPLYDLVGKVISMNKRDRIKLLMNLFNRDIVVEFSIGDVEVVGC